VNGFGSEHRLDHRYLKPARPFAQYIVSIPVPQIRSWAVAQNRLIHLAFFFLIIIPDKQPSLGPCAPFMPCVDIEFAYIHVLADQIGFDLKRACVHFFVGIDFFHQLTSETLSPLPTTQPIIFSLGLPYTYPDRICCRESRVFIPSS